MEATQRPRLVHGIPAFFAGLAAALLAGMAVRGIGALVDGAALGEVVAVVLGGALVAALPFGPLAALAFVPVFLLLRAFQSFRPALASVVFGALSLLLAFYMESSTVGVLALAVAGLVFGLVAAATVASAAARDAS